MFSILLYILFILQNFRLTFAFHILWNNDNESFYYKNALKLFLIINMLYGMKYFYLVVYFIRLG